MDILKDKPENNPGFWSLRSFRHGLTWVLCMVMLANTWARNTLSMAMVCMVNATALVVINHNDELRNISSIDDNTKEFGDCGSVTSGDLEDYGGSILWTSTEQGLLFSAIYFGGAIIIFPGAWFIKRYGPKHILMFCLLITLICTLLTPVTATYGGLIPTFVVRFLMGFGDQVMLYTAITMILAHWIPPAEKSTALAIFSSGNQLGVVLAMPINAALCRNKHFLGGWPAIFYVSGLIVLLAAILVQVFVDSSPTRNKWITPNERDYIIKSLQAQNLGKQAVPPKIPWKQICTSNVLWSCTATAFSTSLVTATLQSYIPTYYKQALHIDLNSNGLFSAIPYLSQWIFKMVLSIAADAMKKHTRLSHTLICKLFNNLGLIMAAVFLIGCAFMSCHEVAWAIVLLSLANGAYTTNIPGAMTALVCIAPAFTGVVNAISRFGGQVASIIAPYIVGSIVTEGTVEQWRIIFYIMGGGLVACALYFQLAGTVEIQEWAKIDQSNNEISRGAQDLSASADNKQTKSLRIKF